MAEISPIAASKAQVLAAIRQAGAATGAGFDFLTRMAARESSFDASAKAKTSSAAGLFQFIEQTWLGAMKAHGDKHGFGEFARDIEQDARGRFMVSNEARRREILDLRFEASASAAMAGELANENRSYLETRLGRVANAADLYTAHFLGPAGAVKLLAAGANVEAATLLPKAAAANRAVFYDGARAKTVGEVIGSIARSMGGANNAGAAAPTKPAPSMQTIATAPRIAHVADLEAALSGAPARRAPAMWPDAPRSTQAPAMHGFNLNTVTLAILQALEPQRLGADRDDARAQARRAS